MIGNDIVDLHLAERESYWQRQGYLNKIFTADEQSFILASADPTTAVWLLWSCKEAVYKIVHRHTRVRTYAPLKFNCSVTAGTVTYEGHVYPFRSLQSGYCIHTIAVEKAELFDALEIYTEDALKREQWDISKDDDGVPYLEGSPVSISHHGRFAGLVIYRSNNYAGTLHMI
ncbi:4'-phosphopantetheinyl transferase superfamily protein [Chitinophaga sp. CF118]|uniref:4'-phosphopantetheinyl transferase family protein n=1 Tax=Chitinophaga sp. CF118 TaxID=1884367 RepID=UPI0008F05717|nr:4'-phosphopantetheinyl transferase superfamily protein [Chitinophaga sp. CF118]SFD76102.1 4'-phosphopantetheinyl transferase superfamily protein [Chitinophaga sp. CF118]